MSPSLVNRQYNFFSVPVTGGSDFEDNLNSFLRSVRVITIHRELICQDNRCYWAIVVEYQTGEKNSVRKNEPAKKRVDYKEVLSPEDFTTFARLRDWRKETAAREAVQLYNVFMNDQLAAINGAKANHLQSRTQGN